MNSGDSSTFYAKGVINNFYYRNNAISSARAIRNNIILGLSFLMMMGIYLAFNDGNIKSYIALFVGLGILAIYYGKKIKQFRMEK